MSIWDGVGPKPIGNYGMLGTDRRLDFVVYYCFTCGRRFRRHPSDAARCDCSSQYVRIMNR